MRSLFPSKGMHRYPRSTAISENTITPGSVSTPGGAGGCSEARGTSVDIGWRGGDFWTNGLVLDAPRELYIARQRSTGDGWLGSFFVAVLG